MYNEDDDDLERSEFDIWYDDNYSYFKRGTETFVEPGLEVELFYKAVYGSIMKELPRVARKLLIQHYPIIDTEFRPAILEAIEQKLEMTGHIFLLNLYDLMLDKKQNLNLREKYSDFETWEKRKKESEVINRSIFNSIAGLTSKQKDDLYELAKREFKSSYNFKDQRLYEFIEILQPLVFKYYPAIQDLDADGWVMYYKLLTLEHVEFRIRFEYFDEFIEYDFPEEDLYIPYSEFHKKLQQKFADKRDKERKLRESGNEDLV